MKDFYDIYYLALTFDFAGEKLTSALAETLRNRKTEVDTSSFERLVKLADNTDIQTRWRYFQKTINQTGLPLSDVMSLLGDFLRPVFNAVLSGNNLTTEWSAKRRKWE
jgi:hypothetical protein